MQKLIGCFFLSLSFYFLKAEAQVIGSGNTLSEPPKIDLYDSDPDHLWNRLYSALFLRVDRDGKQYGPHALDLLFWTETKHLLSEPSYSRAIQVLDEFIANHGERLIEDPLKRAILQRDLWALFEWSARVDRDNCPPATQAIIQILQQRLATVMRHIALSKKQIESLPNNYAEAIASKEFSPSIDDIHGETPFLPADLFQADGPWVCMGNGGQKMPLAADHIGGSSGRSAFYAFLRLPNGRDATIAYIEKIRKLDHPWMLNPNSSDGAKNVKAPRYEPPVIPNPETPQIPSGTMVALVRQMLLLDDEGKLVVSPLIESVQIRVYHQIAAAILKEGEKSSSQSFYEFILDRSKLFKRYSGGLIAQTISDMTFTFGPDLEMTGKDPFEGVGAIQVATPTMTTCIMCHNNPGVYSINSIARLFDRKSQARLRTLQTSTPIQEQESVRQWKEGYYYRDIKKLLEKNPRATQN